MPKVFEENWAKAMGQEYASASERTKPFIVRLTLEPRFANERRKIEKWYQELPENVRIDKGFLNDLRSTDIHQHSGAYHELVLYHFLKSLGYNVEMHIEISRQVPDFRITGNRLDKPVIIEVATVFDDPKWQEKERRFNLILERLDKIEHLCRLSVSLRSKDIPDEVDYDQLADTVVKHLDELINELKAQVAKRTFHYRENDLDIEFLPLLLPKKGSVVVSHSLGARWVGSDQIKNAVEAKINKYKFVREQDLPFVVALNLNDVPAGEDGLINELMGQVTVTITRGKNGEPIRESVGRNFKGLVTPKPGLGGKPRNTRLSAVIVVDSKWLNPDSEGEQEQKVHFFRLIPNYWACNPLSPEFMKYQPRIKYTVKNETELSFEWINKGNEKAFSL